MLSSGESHLPSKHWNEMVYELLNLLACLLSLLANIRKGKILTFGQSVYCHDVVVLFTDLIELSSQDYQTLRQDRET